MVSTDDIVKIKMHSFNDWSYDEDNKIEYSFEVLRKMEFNSDRKRMSILVRDPTDCKIKLFIKGADSIIKSRLDKNQLQWNI